MDSIRYNTDREKTAEKSCQILYCQNLFSSTTSHSVFCILFFDLCSGNPNLLAYWEVLWNLSFFFFQKFFIRQLEKFENMKLTQLNNLSTRKENPKIILEGSKNVLRNHDIFRFILYFWASQTLHYQKWGVLWTVHYAFFPAQACTYSEQMQLLVGRASGPTKITDPEFESLSTTLISCYCHRPQQSGALLPSRWACPTQLPTPDNTAEEPRGSCTRCFCQHSFPHRPSPISFVTVNWHQSCWIMIQESQKCYLCCRNKAHSLSLFPAGVKMESLIFVLAPPVLALQVKKTEFSSFGLG